MVYTDSSPIAAAGYWKTNGEWFVYRWPSAITNAKHVDTIWMEMCAILLAVSLWGPRWSGYKVNLKTDNLLVANAWSTDNFRSKATEDLSKNLSEVVHENDFVFNLYFIHRNQNLADAIAHNNKKLFLQRNPSATHLKIIGKSY